jgi:F-box protein 11
VAGQSGVAPAAFLSYAHADDENDDGLITAFRARLQSELCAQTGRRDLRIFLDKDMDWVCIAWSMPGQTSAHPIRRSGPTLFPHSACSDVCVLS